MAPDQAPRLSASAAPPPSADRPTAASQSASAGRPDRDDQPVMPRRSLDDTDIGWGERPEPDDDERLSRERPPHWDEP
ncbi:MAG TPA: hypothetical protein VGL63_12060 [Streptosporangiaceae bacterium]